MHDATDVVAVTKGNTLGMVRICWLVQMNAYRVGIFRVPGDILMSSLLGQGQTHRFEIAPQERTHRDLR